VCILNLPVLNFKSPYFKAEAHHRALSIFFSSFGEDRVYSRLKPREVHATARWATALCGCHSPFTTLERGTPGPKSGRRNPERT